MKSFFHGQKRKRSLLTAGSAALYAVLAGTPASAEPTIEIVSSAVDRGYAFAGLVRSESPFEGRAILEIARTGATGNARTRQGGAIDLTSGDIVFARSRISVDAGDTVDVTAILYDAEGVEVSRFATQLD